MYESQSTKKCFKRAVKREIFKIKIAKDTLAWIYLLEEFNGQKNQISLNLEV